MSSVDKLDPFLVDGISRVGRRQKRVPFGSETKYPIILPKFSHFTHLIVGDFHVKCDHCGLKHTLAALCRIYWGNGYCASKILTSLLLKDSKAWKLMAELPNSRLQLSLPPFAHIGCTISDPYWFVTAAVKQTTTGACSLVWPRGQFIMRLSGIGVLTP